LSEPVIRAFAEGDERGIIDLYRLVFGLELSLADWQWYYQRRAVIVVAESAGAIVGHYAVQERPFRVGGQARMAGLAMGSMVAPEFRNIRTFIDLAKLAYASCRERAIEFLYAFPNDNVWPVRRRMLDWQALPSLVALVADTAALRVVASDVAVERLLPSERLPDAPWLSAADDRVIRAAYSPELVAWRFMQRPSVDYPVYVARHGSELLGFVALKRYDGGSAPEGHILALRVAPGAETTAGAALLARASAACRRGCCPHPRSPS
jgi:hypothetical protein